MQLICARTLATTGKKEKTECTREEHLHYPEVIREIHSALVAGYRMSGVSDGEMAHSVTFMKYGRGDTFILYITVRGTREEINDLQEDPLVKKYFFM